MTNQTTEQSSRDFEAYMHRCGYQRDPVIWNAIHHAWQARDTEVAALKAEIERLKASAALESSNPCPHVYTGKDGTSHCTLAASEAAKVQKLVESLFTALQRLASPTAFYSSKQVSSGECRRRRDYAYEQLTLGRIALSEYQGQQVKENV